MPNYNTYNPNRKPLTTSGGGLGGAAGRARTGAVGTATQQPTAAPAYPVPPRPTYNGITDESGGVLPQYSTTARTAEMGSAGNAMVARATETGPSPWLKLQLQGQGLEETAARGDVTATAASQAANARSNLAMRGGLSGGSRERIGMAGMENAMNAQQGVIGQGMQNRLGLQVADEQQKMSLLGQAAGLQNQTSQFNAGQLGNNDRFNATNAIGDRRGRSAFDMGLYVEGMKDRAAGLGAEALLDSTNKPAKTPWETIVNPLGLGQ